MKSIQAEQLADGITLYEGDCLDVLPLIPAGVVKTVISDPPYGVDFDTDYRRFTAAGKPTNSTNHRPVANDDKPFDPSPFLEFPRVVLWGGRIVFRHDSRRGLGSSGIRDLPTGKRSCRMPRPHG